MNGIDNIKNKILGDAEAEAAKLTQAATEQAEAKAKEAAELLSKEKSGLLERGAKQAKIAAERIVSSAAKEHRKNSLSVKQELIEEVFTEAKARLEELSGEDYSKLLIRLISENADSRKEEVLFPAGDADIAESIVSGVNAAIGGSLRVSEKTAPFSKGVVLRDGDVEVNLSMANIADFMREDLTPQVASILFG